jgi:hypothetical protein
MSAHSSRPESESDASSKSKREDTAAMTGSVPTQFGSLTGMGNDFNLANNELTSSVPTQLGLMTAMAYYLQLSSNEFCGAWCG